MPRPFEGHYGASLAVAIVALSPFIVVSTAYVLFAKQVQAELGMGNLAVELIVPVALEQGSKFAIREGGLTVGAGVITKILD